MSVVSVREFSYNPSAMFARVETGEIIEVTRHGKVIAVLLPGGAASARYTSLLTRGLIKLGSASSADLDRIPVYPVPEGVSPLDLLLEERAEDDR